MEFNFTPGQVLNLINGGSIVFECYYAKVRHSSNPDGDIVPLADLLEKIGPNPTPRAVVPESVETAQSSSTNTNIKNWSEGFASSPFGPQNPTTSETANTSKPRLQLVPGSTMFSVKLPQENRNVHLTSSSSEPLPQHE